MPTFICFINWTDQGAKNIKDVGKRSQAAHGLAQNWVAGCSALM